jgi:hypothetical protein
MMKALALTALVIATPIALLVIETAPRLRL